MWNRGWDTLKIVIARPERPKQSRTASTERAALDCFVAALLAMTRMEWSPAFAGVTHLF